MNKLLLIFLLLTNIYANKTTDSSGNLVYIFDVENGSMVDTYFNIFNTIAQFFQSPDYLELLKIVFLVGGFLVLTISIMNAKQGIGLGSLKTFVKYLLIGTGLLTIMFSHKSQMIIKTNNIPSFCPIGISSKESIITTTPTTGVVVGNIPEALAWTFSLINEVGKETTRFATMGFTAVDADLTTYTSKSDAVSYLQGINTVLNSKITDFTTDFGSADKMTLMEGLDSIYRDCIAAPASVKGEDGSTLITAISNTGNLRQTLKDYFGTSVSEVNVYLNPTSPDKNTLITDFRVNNALPGNLLGSLNGEIFTCQEIWLKVDHILYEIQNSDKLLCKGNLKDYWNPETMNILTGDKTLTGSAAGKNIVLNAALANQMYDVKNNIAPGELSFATGKTIAELVTDNVGQGFYVAQMLPYLQMGMRAVMYAFFPLVFIVMLLPGGMSVLKNYLQTLIWIELWSPMAAVLNMFLSLVSTDKFSEMYQTDGFNPAQGIGLLNDSAMIAGVAGYLYGMIPGLTWLLLKSSGSLLSGIGEGLASKLSANLTSDSINKDLSQISSNKKINEERREKGLKTISLAEQDSLNSRINALDSAGNFDQKNSNMDKLFDGSAAKTKLDINKNFVDAEMFLNNPNADKNMGAVNAEQKGNIMKLAEQKTLTNEIDINGNVNDKRVKEIGVGEGRKAAQNTIATQEEMDKTLKATNGDINKAAQVLGREAFQNTVKEMSEEKFQALVHKVDPANADLLAKMRIGVANTNAMKSTISEFTEQSKQIQLGLFKQNNDSWINRNDLGDLTLKDNSTGEKILNISSATATTEVVENLTAQTLRDTFSKEQRVEKNVIGEAVEIGENNLKTMNEKINRIDNVLSMPSNKESKKGGFNKIAEDMGFISTQGKAGEMFNNISSDVKAKILTNAELTGTKIGINDSEAVLSDILYKTKLFNELAATKIGLSAITEANTDKNLTIDQINENAKNSRNKEFDIQKAIIADSALLNLNDSVEAFNSIKDKEIAHNLLKDAGVKDFARSKVTNEFVEMKSTNNVRDMVGLSVMVAAAEAKELLSYAKSVTGLFDLTDYDREKKKPKGQIEEENRKKRIQEIDEKRAKGLKVSVEEEKEYRRLSGKQNSLENMRKDSIGRQEKIKILKEKAKFGNLTDKEEKELKRLIKVEKAINFEPKQQPLSKKLKALMTVNGLANAGKNLVQGGARLGIELGKGAARSAVGEVLGLGEVELAVDAARTIIKTPGALGAAGGTAVATVITTSVNDNLDTTKEYKKGMNELIALERQGMKALEENKIGVIGSINVSKNQNEEHIVEFERSSNGNYNFIINGNRYKTDITDSDFGSTDGRMNQFTKGGNFINSAFFVEALDDAFKERRGIDIQNQINGALSVSHTMNDGLKSSFVANVKEWAVEKFVPTEYSGVDIKK